MGHQPTRLYLAELDKLAEKLIWKNLAEPTQHSYHSGQTCFLTPRQWANIRAVSAFRVIVVLCCDLHGRRKAGTPHKESVSISHSVTLYGRRDE